MVIVTEWNEFRMIDLLRAKELMADSKMVDLRNIYDAERLGIAGFQYWGVGR
jgi:UDPglucose 6-dehydrogenase